MSRPRRLLGCLAVFAAIWAPAPAGADPIEFSPRTSFTAAFSRTLVSGYRHCRLYIFRSITFSQEHTNVS